MFKVVSFPDFGCGGIICASLNHDNVPILSNGEIPSKYHNALKIGPSIVGFDKNKWNEAKLESIDYEKFWLGTHAHPSYIIDDPQVEIILYVNVASMESRCLLAARQCKAVSYDKIECMKACLLSRYKDNTIWTQTIHSNPKIISLDFYHLINTPSYRNMRFGTNEIVYDENKWDEWYRYNDFRNDVDLMLSQYPNLNIHA